MMCAALFLLFAAGAKSQGTFTIEGRLTGVEDGILVRLSRNEERVMNCIATDTLRNGTFRFEDRTSGNDSERLMVNVDRHGFPNMWLDVWVAPGAKVTIEGTNKLIRTWQVNSTVKEQVLQNRYIDVARSLIDEQQRLAVRYMELWEIRDSSSASKEEKEAAKKEGREIISRMKEASEEEIPVYIKLMQENPVDKAWLGFMQSLSLHIRYAEESPYRKEAEALYARLSEADKATDVGRSITVNLFLPEVVKPGDDMADTDLYDLNGGIHHLSDYKGKYLLLDFWSRGCGPCRMAVPEMREIAEQYKERLTVVSVNIDGEKNWREVSEEENLTWENLHDRQGQDGLYARYGVRGIPHYVWISPEGKILGSWFGYGKGLLKLKVRLRLDMPKEPMSVTCNGNVRKVNYPVHGETNAEYLYIRQVELTDTATILRIRVFYTPHNWVRFGSGTCLVADGKAYKITGGEGVKVDEKFRLPESGEADMALYFEPLPLDTPSFDYIEGHSDDDWYIRDIRLKMAE